MSSKITAVITQANITGNITHQSINANVGVGVAGKSAYESALEGGFIGTEEDFNEAFTTMTTLDDYALITHNHDSSYSALTHNHNANYSDINHNHTGVYQVVMGADDNYVTDNEKSTLHAHSNKTALDNVSGTNTGDETTSTIKTKLGITTLSGSNTGDQDISGKQDTLVSGTNIKTINNNSVLGSGNITISSGAITNNNAKLSADITLTNSNQWYDTVSLSLSAGTYLVEGFITQNRSTTTAETVYGRISDGTNHFASTQMYKASVTGNCINLALSTIITLSNTTTIKLQCATSAGNSASKVIAATTANGSGNNATIINAIKLS